MLPCLCLPNRKKDPKKVPTIFGSRMCGPLYTLLTLQPLPLTRKRRFICSTKLQICYNASQCSVWDGFRTQYLCVRLFFFIVSSSEKHILGATRAVGTLCSGHALGQMSCAYPEANIIFRFLSFNLVGFSQILHIGEGNQDILNVFLGPLTQGSVMHMWIGE